MSKSSVLSLRGAWRITQRLDAGFDDREPDDDDKFLWFLDDTIVTGDRWAAWDMPYVARDGTDCGEIDVTRDDVNKPWLQRGIFSVSDNTLRLCMAGRDSDARPNEFASTPTNRYLLYIAERSTEPLPT